MDARIRELLFQVNHHNDYMENLNLEVLDVNDGYAKGRIRVEDRFLNPGGTVHGGVLFSLADIIAGTAACGTGFLVCTVSGNMNYLLPAVNTEYVTCEAKAQREGKNLAVYEIEIRDDAGKLIQTGTFTYFLTETRITDLIKGKE